MKATLATARATATAAPRCVSPATWGFAVVPRPPHRAAIVVLDRRAVARLRSSPAAKEPIEAVAPIEGTATLAEVTASVRRLSSEVAAARDAADSGAAQLAEAWGRLAAVAREKTELGSQLAAAREEARVLHGAIAALRASSAAAAAGGGEPSPGSEDEMPEAWRRAASDAEARCKELAGELEQLRATQQTREALVKEWAEEAAISCQLATSAAEAHATVAAELQASEASLASARRELEELRGALTAAAARAAHGAPPEELEAARRARLEAESALATALAHLSETEEEVDVQAALITRLREDATQLRARGETTRLEMARELDESNELLAGAEARLAEMGRRMRDLLEGAREVGAAEPADAAASAPAAASATPALSQELQLLRDEVNFLQLELEAEMTFCEQAAQRATEAEEEAATLRSRLASGPAVGALGALGLGVHDAAELQALVESQAKALVEARGQATKAAAEAERYRAKVASLERSQKSRGQALSLFGGWGRGSSNSHAPTIGTTSLAELKKMTLEEAIQRVQALEVENAELRTETEDLGAVLNQSRAFIDSTLASLSPVAAPN